MKGISGEKLERLAGFAMLALDPREEREMARALEKLLGLIGQDGDFPAPGELLAPAPSQALLADSRQRPDALGESLPLELTLANAPAAREPFFQLPGVLE